LNNPQAHVGPLQLYQRDLQDGIINPDAAQLQAVQALQLRFLGLCNEWLAPVSPLKKLTRLFVRERSPVRMGLYFWGGVGRGKTYLMDLFFHALPGERKLRMHFHRFMQMVHKRLREEQGRSDPLLLVAQGIAAKVDVICFDEFFVSDIGDAMILATLLEALFGQGVMLVATSNIEPARLYERGLQRQRFLPAIDQIRRHTEVMNVDGGIDYRLRSMDKVAVYLWPADAASKTALTALYDDLTRGMHVESPKPLEIEGREVLAQRWSEGVAWFDFATLCRGARGAADYIELARQFHTVFIEGLPCFTERADDEARRFIMLVDEFYDHGVKLVVSAACGLADLYAGEDLRFPFERTRSRLLEMQTRDYLAQAHRPD
jgi:cell division protein ZapE